MPTNFEHHLAELNKDLSKGLDSALQTPPAVFGSEAPRPLSGKEKVLGDFRKLVITLLEEGKIDHKMTIGELPAFLKDEMSRLD